MLYSIQPTEVVLHVFLVSQIISLFVCRMKKLHMFLIASVSSLLFFTEAIDVYFFNWIISVHDFEGIINPQIIKVYLMIGLFPVNIFMYFFNRRKVFSVLSFVFSFFCLVSIFIIHYGYIGVGLHSILNEAKSDIEFKVFHQKGDGKNISDIFPNLRFFVAKDSSEVKRNVSFFEEPLKISDSELLVHNIMSDMKLVYSEFKKNKQRNNSLNRMAYTRLLTTSNSQYYIYSILYDGYTKQYRIIVDTTTAKNTFHTVQELISTFTLVASLFWMMLMMFVFYFHSNNAFTKQVRGRSYEKR